MGLSTALALVQSRALHENDADASAGQRVSRAVTEAFVSEQLEGFINGLQDELPGKNAAVVRNLLHLVSSRYCICFFPT